MYILCDTCSVLMLIRIAPDMFTDPRFECVTLQEICDEVFQTQRFKAKYPWRTDHKNRIVPSRSLRGREADYDIHMRTIRHLVDEGKTSVKTGKSFGLSRVDMTIAAYVNTYDLEISSTDNSLVDFLEQEFEKKNRSPLAILNHWMQKGLVKWDDRIADIIQDWERNNEPVQPAKDKKQFSKLTKRRYKGP